MMNLDQTMVEALENAARDGKEDRGYVFQRRNESIFVSYSDLWDKARAYAGYYQQGGVKPGEYVALILPTSPEFAYCYFGLMLCGAIPTALASPMFGDPREGFNRLNKIGELLEIKHIVLNKKEYSLIGNYLDAYEVLLSEQLPADQVPIESVHRPLPDDIAIIQATSGSTGLSKAVPLSHRNLIANVQQLGDTAKASSDTVIVSWLPLYHDFGLIGQFLSSIYWQMKCVLMSPFDFMKRPLAWLQLVSDHKATITASPNFALSYTVARVGKDKLNDLDLSSLELMVVGSEPVSMDTLRRFGEHFESTGFKSRTFTPAYGGAECCLLLAMKEVSEDLDSDVISRSALSKDGLIEPPKDDHDCIEFADCGIPAIEAAVQIRDSNGIEINDNHAGHIWWSSPSLTRGYIGQEELNTKEFVDGWFDSGDQGYLKNGRVFVTGRYKEIVIVRGQNYIPMDFEAAAAEVDGTKEGRVVAFGDVDDETCTEELILVCGIDMTAGHDQKKLEVAVKSHVADKTGITPYRVRFIPDKMMPRTTSGKLQRGKVKDLYLSMKKQ